MPKSPLVAVVLAEDVKDVVPDVETDVVPVVVSEALCVELAVAEAVVVSEDVAEALCVEDTVVLKVEVAELVIDDVADELADDVCVELGDVTWQSPNEPSLCRIMASLSTCAVLSQYLSTRTYPSPEHERSAACWNPTLAVTTSSAAIARAQTPVPTPRRTVCELMASQETSAEPTAELSLQASIIALMYLTCLVHWTRPPTEM